MPNIKYVYLFFLILNVSCLSTKLKKGADCLPTKYEIWMEDGFIKVKRPYIREWGHVEIWSKKDRLKIISTPFQIVKGTGASKYVRQMNPVSIPIKDIPVGGYIVIVCGESPCNTVLQIAIVSTYITTEDYNATIYCKVAHFVDRTLSDPYETLKAIEETIKPLAKKK